MSSCSVVPSLFWPEVFIYSVSYTHLKAAFEEAEAEAVFVISSSYSFFATAAEL